MSYIYFFVFTLIFILPILLHLLGLLVILNSVFSQVFSTLQTKDKGYHLRPTEVQVLSQQSVDSGLGGYSASSSLKLELLHPEELLSSFLSQSSMYPGAFLSNKEYFAGSL